MTFFQSITTEEAVAKLSEYSRRFTRAFDGLVYHYTTLSGLAGILNAEALYCSDYRQLNDSSEFHFGMEILEAYVAARGSELGLTPEQLSKMLAHLVCLRRGNAHVSIFTASFCLWPNDLALWRAYAPEDGVSIGFSLDNLKSHAEHHGFACGAVRYYDEPHFQEWFNVQVRELKRGLDRIVENEAGLSRDFEIESDQADLMLNGMKHKNTDRWIAEVSSLVKIPDFSSEHEWRCSYAWLASSARAQPRVYARSLGSRAIPFIELPVKKGSGLIRKINIGPSPRAEQNFHAACQLTQGWEVSIELPKHSYRG